MTILILALVGILTLSYFIIRDANMQANIVDENDPTDIFWDDDDVHTEHEF